jgi:hypothetical protein
MIVMDEQDGRIRARVMGLKPVGGWLSETERGDAVKNHCPGKRYSLPGQ